MTQAFPTEWFVYWDNERAFKINETETAAESFIQNIIDIAGHNVHKLKYVFSQLEVNLNPKLFKQIIDNIIEQTQQMSQTASLKILLENAKKVNNFPQKEIRQYLSKNKQNKGFYSKRWLTDFLAKLLKFNSRQEYISKYQKTLQ